MTEIHFFCKNPTKEVFHKFPIKISQLFLKLSIYCIEKNKGNVELAKTILKFSKLTIYTDGSCSPNPGKGGWAYICLDNKEIGSGCDVNSTNNIMEMMAVISALEHFKDYPEINIVTDSQYVINCAEGKWKRKANQEFWKRYDECAKNRKIVFTWVKGHGENINNNRVDALANSARMQC